MAVAAATPWRERGTLNGEPARLHRERRSLNSSDPGTGRQSVEDLRLKLAFAAALLAWFVTLWLMFGDVL